MSMAELALARQLAESERARWVLAGELDESRAALRRAGAPAAPAAAPSP
eukprot:gene19341-39048_t